VSVNVKDKQRTVIQFLLLETDPDENISVYVHDIDGKEA
jgi:hypothetical protein